MKGSYPPIRNMLPPRPAAIKHRNRGCDKCGQPTREGKSLCLDDILDAPYAGMVSKAWDERLAELDGTTPTPNLVLPDARLVIAAVLTEFDFVTTARLARDLQATLKVASKIARMLGMRRVSNKRGDEAWKPAKKVEQHRLAS